MVLLRNWCLAAPTGLLPVSWLSGVHFEIRKWLTFQPFHRAVFSSVWFVCLLCDFEFLTVSFKTIKEALMLSLLLSLVADIYISVGQGHNWSAIAMVTKGENEQLVQGEVYQA